MCRSSYRRAFSLVELLVVIAVIVLLIGILLPVLAGARAAGRQTKCLSGMHQMGIALTVYANDWRSSLPYPNWGPVAAKTGWLYGVGVDTAAGNPDDRKTGSLWQYLDSEEAYRCPSHKGPYQGTANMTSFIMNGAIIGYGAAQSPYRIEQFPGDAVGLWDGNEQPEFGPPYNDGASYPREVVPGHHGTAVTCMVMDASTVSLTTEQFMKLRDDVGFNRFWCSPANRSGH